MGESFYCGLDIGTSSTKAILFDRDLQVVYRISHGYRLLIEGTSRAELDPGEVLAAVMQCLKEALAAARSRGGEIAFVAISSALHSLIAVDRDFTPLTGCLTWADTRALECSEELKELYASRHFYFQTGCPAHVIYAPARLRWWQSYEPDIIERAAGFITIKEYVLYRLTGQWVVDYSLASGSGLLNLYTRAWEKGLLALLGLEDNKLGRLVDGTTTLTLTREAAVVLGADVPLVVGSGDGPLANLGAGGLINNSCVATIGTSGAIRVFSPEPRFDARQRTWCYMLDRDTYLVGGAINNGGLALNWFRDNFGSTGEDYEAINALARDVPPGSRGLIFLPFLTGERSPNWNPYARGLMVGLDLAHGRKEMARAVLEGVIFRMYSIFRALEELMGTFPEVLVNGGFTNSDLWLQIMADVFNRRIIAYQTYDSSALGAVIMGLKALGLIKDYRSLDYQPTVKDIKKPVATNVRQYQRVYQLYEEIYAANALLFKKLAGLRCH
ncbi:Xylulose kinase [Neomoorella glycerini]|uniref:Xylulose kinase n=1 Tax=Neomoorella glycerini TaxID=55779 RepID=A0A6I5ZPZ9_9FIRM|nr:gluconokinase [Moorella glycerini]QGP92052.1 Xylulose kinase [Moorella glycerini]